MRTNTDLATMEGANEAARRAVNAILDATKSPYSKCQIWEMYKFHAHSLDYLAPYHHHDSTRFKKGLPWNGKIIG